MSAGGPCCWRPTRMCRAGFASRDGPVIDIRDETFGGTFPWTPHYHAVNGVRLHFVDEGAGEPIVMLHGDPTWGYLYRTFIPALALRRRCIVPDHMGMGKSETPPQPYRIGCAITSPTWKRSCWRWTCGRRPSCSTIGVADGES